MPTSKAEFERLAEARLSEAEHLLAGGFFDGAYYLAGYAVECALKAIYCTRFGNDELPDKQAVIDGYTHRLTDLVRLCQIEGELRPVGSARQKNWAIVTGWSEASRYGRARVAQEAADLIQAVADPREGILIWLRSKW